MEWRDHAHKRNHTEALRCGNPFCETPGHLNEIDRLHVELEQIKGELAGAWQTNVRNHNGMLRAMAAIDRVRELCASVPLMHLFGGHTAPGHLSTDQVLDALKDPVVPEGGGEGG